MIPMLTFATITLFCASGAQNELRVDSISKITSSHHAFSILEKAENFADSGISIAGETPSEHFAVVYLVRHKSGHAYLRKLLESQNWHSRLYALCGLYYVDRDLFFNFSNLHKHSTAVVSAFSGCIIHKATVGGFIYSGKGNSPRIVCNPYTEDIDHAMARILPRGDGDFDWDILGGGIPANIMKLGSK